MRVTSGFRKWVSGLRKEVGAAAVYARQVQGKLPPGSMEGCLVTCSLDVRFCKRGCVVVGVSTSAGGGWHDF